MPHVERCVFAALSHGSCWYSRRLAVRDNMGLATTIGGRWFVDECQEHVCECAFANYDAEQFAWADREPAYARHAGRPLDRSCGGVANGIRRRPLRQERAGHSTAQRCLDA